MPQGVINDLLTSTKHVFTRVLSIALDADPTMPPDQDVQRQPMTAILNLSGNKAGVLSLHCSVEAADLLAGKILGSARARSPEDAEDAVGEVANMIAGHLKTAASGRGQSFDLSVPTIIVGGQYRVRSLVNAPSIVLEFRSQGHSFYIKLVQAE